MTCGLRYIGPVAGGYLHRCARDDCSREIKASFPESSKLVLACVDNNPLYYQTTGNSTIENGPGTKLQKLLLGFGLQSCTSCNSTATWINGKGPEWVRDNISTVVAVMERNLETNSSVRMKLLRWATTEGIRGYALEKLILKACSMAEQTTEYPDSE